MTNSRSRWHQTRDYLNELEARERVTNGGLSEHINAYNPHGKMTWKNVWSAGEYQQFDVVTHNGWTMVANKTTSDPAAPQVIGNPDYIYDGTTTTQSVTAKQVIFGQRYAPQDRAVLVVGYRLYTTAGNTYTVYTVDDPLGTPVINEVLSVEAGTSGWNEFNISGGVIRVGQTVDVMVVAYEPDGTPTTFNADYDYTTPQNTTVPTTGLITHSRSNPGVMRIHKTDALSGTPALNTLTVGDVINGAGQSWAIQTITDGGTYYEYGVAPASNGSPTGIQTFTFETVTATPISYEQDTGYWTGNTAVRGLYGADTAYPDITPDDNQYGVDLQVQEYLFSDDWDILAVNANAIVGGDNLGINANGQRTFWDDIQTSLIGRRLSSTAGVVNYNWSENTVDFSQNGSITNTNDVTNWNLQLPHGTKIPSNLNVHIHFEQSDATVRTMTIRYRLQSNGQQKTTTWTTVAVPTSSAVWTWTTGTLINILPLVSVDLTGAGISDIVQFQMTRTDSNGGTLPVTFADAHVERDQLGSGEEYQK